MEILGGAPAAFNQKAKVLACILKATRADSYQ